MRFLEISVRKEVRSIHGQFVLLPKESARWGQVHSFQLLRGERLLPRDLKEPHAVE